MFYLLLAVNAYTDLKGGSVYDLLSVLLFMAAAAEKGLDLKAPYFMGCLFVLAGLFILDRKEEWLGRGDYLILLSVSLYAADAFPLILLITSACALIFLAFQQGRTVPLVPFLFAGAVLAKLPLFLWL